MIIHLICGSSILITSIYTDQLCFGCFALLSLIYPLNWANSLITSLPKRMLEMTESPVPHIMGIPFKTFLTKKHYSEIVFYLDFGIFSSEEESDSYICLNDHKIQVLIQKIEANLKNELSFYSTTGVFPAYRIQLILWRYIHAIFIIASEITNITDPDSFKLEFAEKFSSFNNPTDLQKTLKDSSVVSMFIDHILDSSDNYIPKDYYDVLKDPKMLSLINHIIFLYYSRESYPKYRVFVVFPLDHQKQHSY